MENQKITIPFPIERSYCLQSECYLQRNMYIQRILYWVAPLKFLNPCTLFIGTKQSPGISHLQFQ